MYTYVENYFQKTNKQTKKKKSLIKLFNIIHHLRCVGSDTVVHDFQKKIKKIKINHLMHANALLDFTSKQIK